MKVTLKVWRKGGRGLEEDQKYGNKCGSHLIVSFS